MGEKPTSKTGDAAVDKEGQIALWATYTNIVLYALCYQLQRPVEPFLVQSLSSNAEDAASVAQTYGKLQSFFNALQTIGSPVVGIILDRIGCRLCSALVFFSTALSYAILSHATDLKLLFLSQVPTVFQAAFLVAQATAATATSGDAAARAKALGRMTTAYTIGATIGPSLGGYLADQGDLYVSASLAVAGSIVSVIISLMLLPDTQNKDTSKIDESNHSVSLKEHPIDKRSFIQSLQHSLSIGLRPIVWRLLVVKVVGGIVASIHSTALPMVLTGQNMQFEPSQLGNIMSSSMFSVAAFGAFGMSPLTKLLGATGMSNMGLALRALTGPIIAVIISTASGNGNLIVVQIALASVLHALAAHSLATGLTTQTTGGVNKDEQGALLGLEHSLFALARIAGPALGTSLLVRSSEGGFWYVAGACASVDVGLLLFLVSTPVLNYNPTAAESYSKRE